MRFFEAKLFFFLMISKHLYFYKIKFNFCQNQFLSNTFLNCYLVCLVNQRRMRNWKRPSLVSGKPHRKYKKDVVVFCTSYITSGITLVQIPEAILEVAMEEKKKNTQRRSTRHGEKHLHVVPSGPIHHKLTNKLLKRCGVHILGFGIHQLIFYVIRKLNLHYPLFITKKKIQIKLYLPLIYSITLMMWW